MEDLHRNLFKLVVPFVIGGYLSGLVVALLWYHWHPTLRETDIDQLWWLIVCIALLLIILIFSRPVRCILLLTLPSLTSSRGRALLIALAFFLAATGPSANILANVMVMLRSLACSQELLRQVLSQMLDVLLEPVQALRTAFTFMMEEVRRVLRQLTLLLLRIQSYMLIIINTLKSCAAWLKSVVELCNSQLGTPWMRCQRAAETAMLRCRSELGMLKSLCYATKLFLALCYPTKLVDIFCSGFWDPKWELMDPILKRYLEFVATLEQMFDASITFEHEFFFHNNPSKNLSDVGEQIAQDINQDLAPFLRLHSWTHLLCWLLLLGVFIKAIYFYLRYMLSRAYQNVYITSDFYAIDEENWRLNRDTVLPLEYLERFKYLKLSSLRLTQFESLLIAKNSFFMLITCLQLGCICFVDYSLFWLLATISYYGHEQAELEVPAYIDLHIKGGGIVGDIMRGIVNAFRPLTQSSKMDTRLCLPLPNPPRYNHYVEILSLCLLAWIVALTEPYVLRLRHVIMRWIYPERAQERAMYFYEHLFIER
ncbi:CG6845, partial [Drosophila busckii]